MIGTGDQPGLRRIGRLLVLLAVTAMAVTGLTACEDAAPLGVLRQGNTTVILVGYQCPRSIGGLEQITVGRQTGNSSGPALWTIVAQPAVSTPEVTPGTVPPGFRPTVDNLGSAGLGSQFWVHVRLAGGAVGGATFDLSRLKNGQVRNSSGQVITRAAFEKLYKCSSG